jgi:Glycosyl transferase family 2
VELARDGSVSPGVEARDAVPQAALLSVSRRIVGIVLVRNEDVFVEQAVRNVAEFCDRIHAVDHVSTDRTWEALRALAAEYDHLEARREHHAGVSHRLVEPYAGTPTWVFGVDGDELYDEERLRGFRDELLGGAYDGAFKVASNVLNCVALDPERGTASGYLSPPSRSITKLYNFAAIESWAGDGAERLHGGTIVFRPGYGEGSVDNIGERLSWDETPLRCLHACFLRRSSRDPEPGGDPTGRPILEETALQDRSWRGGLKRRLRRRGPPPEASEWKQEKYMRGELVTVDASPFLPARVGHTGR